MSSVGSAPRGHFSNLLSICDQSRNISFLLDSDSSVNLLPKSLIDPTLVADPTSELIAINGSAVTTYGRRSMTLSFNNNLEFECEFLLTDTPDGVIGSEFMTKHGIDLLMRDRQIVHGESDTVLTSIALSEMKSVSRTSDALSNSEKCTELLNRYPELLHDYAPTDVVKHDVVQKVDTGNHPPILHRPRHFHPTKERAIQRTFADLEKRGIVEKVTSPWGFPVHVVPKPGKKLDFDDINSYRVVVDFRTLNKCVVKTSHPIPSIQSIQHRLAGSKIFSSLDLRSAYYSISVAKEDQMKLTAVTATTSYQFKRSPFGLKSSGFYFSLLIAKTLEHIPNVATYLDDICEDLVHCVRRAV